MAVSRIAGRTKFRHTATVIGFLSPWIIGFSVFIAYAVLSALRISFSRYNLLSPPRWTGFENYVQLFTDDVFLKVLGNTLYFTIIAFPVNIVLALTLAIMVNRLIRKRMVGGVFFRLFFFLPHMLPVVAYALVWRWILNAEFGVLNQLITSFGLKGPNWLYSSVWVKPAIIMANLLLIGPQFVIFMAALQEINPQLYEAAEIDGASQFMQVRKIVVPLISPVLLYISILQIIWAFSLFALPLVMTLSPGTTGGLEGGGPNYASTFYMMRLYQVGFTQLDMGYASAMAWVLFAILLVLSLLIIRLTKKGVHYGS